MSGINVSVFVPDETVRTMADELADGSVDSAVQAALGAYRKYDSDGKVPVVRYDEDYDNAVDKALRVANETDGPDLLVIVTDFEANDRPRANLLLEDLGDNFVVFVPVSNQGYDTGYAKWLDDDSPSANKIDVVTVTGLTNPSIADEEVAGWAASVA